MNNTEWRGPASFVETRSNANSPGGSRDDVYRHLFGSARVCHLATSARAISPAVFAFSINLVELDDFACNNKRKEKETREET